MPTPTKHVCSCGTKGDCHQYQEGLKGEIYVIFFCQKAVKGETVPSYCPFCGHRLKFRLEPSGKSETMVKKHRCVKVH